MNFAQSAERLRWRDRARTLATNAIGPRAAAYDREARFPAANIDDLRAAGLLDVLMPTAYGGAGADYQTFALVVGEIAGGCGSTALAHIMHNAALATLAQYGTPAQQDRYFREARQGALFSVVFSEAGSGAQFMRPSTVARPVGDGYRLQGRKAFCTSAGAARYVIVSTVVEPDDVTLFAVESGRPGLTVSETWDAMGMRASASHDLVLNEYEAEDRERIGAVGAGRAIGVATRPPFLIGFAAAYLGIAEAAFRAASDHARTRKRQPENQPLASFQLVRATIADMHLALLAGRLALERAAWSVDAGAPDAFQVMSEAVYLCTTNAISVCDRALQVCGGHGYLRRSPVERYYRDVRAGTLMVGTSDGIRDRLGSTLLGLE